MRRTKIGGRPTGNPPAEKKTEELLVRGLSFMRQNGAEYRRDLATTSEEKAVFKKSTAGLSKSGTLISLPYHLEVGRGTKSFHLLRTQEGA